MSITSLTSMGMSLLMCIIASPLNLSFDIVFRSQVFMRRKADMDRSHSQVVTGTIARILRATKIFGNESSLQLRRVSAMLSYSIFSRPVF